METIFSVEVDRYNPMALANCLKKLADGIEDFEYNWRLSANGGGINYGLFLNIDIEEKTIEICNQPEYGCDDMLEDVLEAIELFKEEKNDE